MNYKAVLFDMNGVIVNDEPLHMVAFQAVLEARGYTLAEEQYNEFFVGRTDADGFLHYFESQHAQVDDMQKLLEEKAEAYQRLATGKLKPFPGVIEFIKDLAINKKFPLALVTSSLRVEAETVLKTFGLTDYFAGEVTADDITDGKPNPEGYLKGAAVLNMQPAECIVIEDAPSGVKAAHAADMKCVAVLNTYIHDQLNNADLVVERLGPGCLDQLD
jgi:HAD superfamily hydrolase (TIGR01509 family)